MPVIFPDAAPTLGGKSYRVASLRYDQYATAVLAPEWVTDQQTAELYAVFHGLRQAVIRKLSYICVATDNSSAYFTMLSCRISARNYARLRIMRRINRLIYQSHCHLQLMWIPSGANLADSFSRTTNYLPLPISYNPDILLSYIPTCRT